MARSKHFLPTLAVAALIAVAGIGGMVLAQIEGADKGVAPADSSGNYEVTGIAIDVAASSADAARQGGWREAQRLGWARLWGRLNGLPPGARRACPTGRSTASSQRSSSRTRISARRATSPA